MSLSRRKFLAQSVAVTSAFSSLPILAACSGSPDVGYVNEVKGFGPLKTDSRGLFDLPRGFEYQVFSATGDTMDDGLLVPGAHDGMAAFEGPDGLITLIRNHELAPNQTDQSAFGPNNERFARIDPSLVYDYLDDGTPLPGGTTTLHIDPKSRRPVRQFLSLAGTHRNCMGGPTPWGSWLTCEETLQQAGDNGRLDHGYAFEIESSATGLVEPLPLRSMGRFQREAVAVDPSTGIVYQTEDNRPSLITRFIPELPGELWRGGRLQALAIIGQPGLNTHNWPESPEMIQVGQSMNVEWVDVEAIHNPDNDIAERMIALGATNFTRGEGMWFGNGEVYFACTDGGPARIGQIWRYKPSIYEGTLQESQSPGELTLFYETSDAKLMEKCDNITVAPWGDLIVVEDGSDEQFIRGVTPEGEVYTIGRNAKSDSTGEYSEICGPCFSPDGSILFFNVQNGPGQTFAVTGPWSRRSSARV